MATERRQVLGQRWSPHVLYLPGQRPGRFTELQRAIPGISDNSLNDRLRDLAAEGLVLRRAFPGPGRRPATLGRHRRRARATRPSGPGSGHMGRGPPAGHTDGHGRVPDRTTHRR
jgi:hypothetical protein